MFDVRPKMRYPSGAPTRVQDIFELTVITVDDDGDCPLSGLASRLHLSEWQVKMLLSNNDNLFSVTEDGFVKYGVPYLCEEHCKPGGCSDAHCERLHVCKFYAIGGCGNRKCQFGHSFDTEHNRPILGDLGVLGLREETMQIAFRNSRQEGLTVPSVCTFYNAARGCTKKKPQCGFLHVCDFYLRGSCRFGKGCKRSHNIYDDQPKSVLEKYMISVDRSPKEALHELQEYMGVERKRHVSSGSNSGDSQKASIDEVPAICSYNFTKCSFGESCRNVHDKKTYRWQYKGVMTSDWTNFDVANDAIETHFRNPNKRTKHVTKNGHIGAVRFDTMVLEFNDLTHPPWPVRRLCTVSSVKATPKLSSVSTTWCWYWKDVDGTFVAYGTRGLTGASTISSDDIEEKYLEDQSGELEFVTGEHKYVLDFGKMKQRNIKYGTEREVRRRPVETKAVVKKGAVAAQALPLHWEPMKTSGAFQLVQISPQGKTRDEYREVESLFHQTMTAKVVRIDRIQNDELWEKYAMKKTRMVEKLGSSGVNEKRLFHGTSRAVIEGICEQGFDWRLTGTRVGTMYGKGSYFHRESTYSSNYTDCSSMFVAKVLAGKFTKGRSDLLRPPAVSEGGRNKMYDSVVDNVSDPKIFVIFTHEQSYPEYKITYQ